MKSIIKLKKLLRKRIISKVFIVSILLFSSTKSFSQQRNYADFINREFKRLENTFDGHIFMEINIDSSNSHFCLIKIDTFHIFLKSEKIWSVDVFKVRIKLEDVSCIYNVIPENEQTITDDTLNYYILSVSESLGNYRLFGFYSSDINLFLKDYGIDILESLSKKLFENNILSKKESKIFYKTLKNGKGEYPVEFNHPCELLKFFFTKKEQYKANTIILPETPLRPYSIKN